MRSPWWLLALAALLNAASPPPAKPLTVAAASDLRQALPALAAAFERETGVRVQVTYGSSGKLFAQIAHGAPYDAFFSANAAYPRKLEAQGLAAPGTRFAYAEGRLVLWTAAGSGLDVKRGMAVLRDSRVAKVAIANPAHAPYGQAAVEALRHAGLYEQVRPKLVLGENISQAAQFAASGSAQLGFVALSLVSTPAMRGGAYWPVPTSWHRPLVQEAVVIARSGKKEAARRFLRYAGSPEGRRTLSRYGLQPPR